MSEHTRTDEGSAPLTTHATAPAGEAARPLVSVVIATRDRLELLRAAVAAVRAQDLDAQVETVLVFDQSEVQESFGDDDDLRPVRTVANTRTPGLAGARNSGIAAAQGEYVAFCDDDDLWLPGRLGAQISALAAAPEASMATCGILVEYEGTRHARSLPRDRVVLAELVRDRHTELHPSTFLFRASDLRTRIGPVSEEVPGGFGEDYELLLRAARSGPIVNVREPLVVVRWHGSSFFFQRWATMAAGLGWILERFEEFDADARGFARIQGQIAFAHAAMGERRQALREVLAAARRNPLEPRLPLAALVALRVLSPALVMRSLHRFGKGI
ncbi:glycosyltransferase [Cellulomonas sp. APG4]|uniref:glycosyltransferase family 2 protein n=1 Tax=Cellulomonas sp. APG4 TaxID=1538656 RepID=UPI00137A9269|nr:glycosyltransferase [Cellulomonas sp. APG4]NCT92603.1 glycosyltransferase [Cellulomonas sp. APG4]